MQGKTGSSNGTHRAWLDQARCDGCQLCLPACSYQALIWVRSDRELMIDPWACTGCGTCITTCPTQALRLVRRAPVG